MSNKIKFSIIIPVKEINDYILAFVPKILSQTYQNFEIIILPNIKKEHKILKNKKIKIIETGVVGPAQKRDIGAEKAKGEILAFIDDDAYPDKNWLENALSSFKEGVVGIGGPNLTPEESSFFQKVSGKVLASYLISGPVSYRCKKSEEREINDFPSCNLFVRRKAFLKVGGFDTGFWPGEDTKLCLELTKTGKLIYSPEVVVYHHRRSDLKGYIKQIFTYSKHRGFFAKKYPETSRKLSYFIPSMFLAGIILGSILSFFNQVIAYIYLFVLLIYVVLLFIEALRAGEISMTVPFIILGFTTHITYGLGFVVGLLNKDLMSKYR